MTMMWSPGCGCCDPCKSEDIGFTPTTKQERGSYAAWIPSNAYTAGDIFHHWKDTPYGRESSWSVPVSQTSGATWDAAEQAKYTFIEEIDWYDEVDEWHLHGSGWLSLTSAQKDDYLRYGKLAEGLGYVTKSAVLPSLANWNVIFEYILLPRVAPYVYPADGLKIRLISQVSLTGSNVPQEYFYSLMEWDETTEPKESPDIAFPPPDLFAPPLLDLTFSRPLKVTLGKIALDGYGAEVDTVFDTHWLQRWQHHRYFCRRPDVNDAFLADIIDINDSPSLPGLNLLPTPDSLGACYIIDNGPGLILEDPAVPGVGIRVDDGDMICLRDWTAPNDKDSWDIYGTSAGSYGYDYLNPPALSDVLSSSLSHENPDPSGDLAGLHVGIIVEQGQDGTGGITVPELTGFGRTTFKLNGTITTPECPRCGIARQCPCSLETEYPVYAELGASADLSKFVSMIMPDPPGPSTYLGVTCARDSGSNWEDLGNLGKSTWRTGPCSWEFVQVHASIYYGADGGMGSGGVQHVIFTYEHVTFVLRRLAPFKVWAQTDATLAWVPTYSGIIKADYSDRYTKAQLLSYLWPDEYWHGRFVRNGIGCNEQRGIIATGSAYAITDLEDFECNNFTIQGTYDVDVLSVTFPDLYENTLIGDTWTVQSI